MPATFRSRQLRHERAMDQRLAAEHRQLAARVAAVVARFATGPERTIPNTRRAREQIHAAVWNQVIRPYYVGFGDDPFQGNEPRSPYARLLFDGVAGGLRIEAERQEAFLRRVLGGGDAADDIVLAWLTGPRPHLRVTELRGTYDPFHRWVDPNGYTLSDRVWRASVDVRARVDRLLDYHIAAGTSAVDIADLLEDFLTPGAKLIKTRTPYGREGSYAARRLARTEITAAAGRGTVNAGAANPFVAGIKWALSGSHPKPDICDDHAAGGPNSDGVYPVDSVPVYPAHPHCFCNLQPQAAGNTADLVQRLRADIQAARPQAQQMRGLFNPGYLVGALLTGALVDAVEALAA